MLTLMRGKLWGPLLEVTLERLTWGGFATESLTWITTLALAPHAAAGTRLRLSVLVLGSLSSGQYGHE